MSPTTWVLCFPKIILKCTSWYYTAELTKLRGFSRTVRSTGGHTVIFKSLSHSITKANTTSNDRHEGKGHMGRQVLAWLRSWGPLENCPQSILSLKGRWSACSPRIKGKQFKKKKKGKSENLDSQILLSLCRRRLMSYACHSCWQAALHHPPTPSLLSRQAVVLEHWPVPLVWFVLLFLGNKSSRFVSKAIVKACCLWTHASKSFVSPNLSKWHK